MSPAIERLAEELMKLSNEEWVRATERWLAGHDWQGVFGPAWDEISERLSAVDREAEDRIGADRVASDAPLPATNWQGDAA